MRKLNQNIFLFIFSIVISANSFAQERKKDTIDTNVINVVKPYTPTISDAFKVKEIPSLDDEETTAKKEIKYNIFSFPVASTFTPAKGKAAVVDKAKPVKLFDNYASLGVGTYTTILGEVYLNHALICSVHLPMGRSFEPNKQYGNGACPWQIHGGGQRFGELQGHDKRKRW